MSIHIPCSTIWDQVKGQEIKQDLGSGFTGALAKGTAKLAGLDVEGDNAVIHLGKDVKKICPGSAAGEVLKIFKKDFDDIACDGLNSYVGSQKISAALKKKIQAMCPSIIKSCTPTICDGKAASLGLSCKDINEIFKIILADPTVIAEIQASLPKGVDITKEDPCKSAQVVAGLGIDVPNVFASVLSKELTKAGIKLPNSEYASIIKCVCPNLKVGGKLDCKEVTHLVDMMLDQPSVQNAIKDAAKMEMTSKTKCTVLQQLIDSGGKPEEIIHKALLKTTNPAYIPSVDKLGEALRCICPHLKPYVPPKGGGGGGGSSSGTKAPVIYNKLGIVAGIVVAVLLLFIVYGITIFVTNFHFSTKMLTFIFLLLLTLLAMVLVFNANPKCLFRACINAGSDWIPVEGTFKGNKSLLGITIDAEMNVKKNNTVELTKLSCKGGTCPFKDLLDKCSNRVIRVKQSKTVYGYPLIGPCIDEIYKLRTGQMQTVTGIWVGQNGSDVYLNVEVEVPVAGTLFLTIPIKKV